MLKAPPGYNEVIIGSFGVIGFASHLMNQHAKLKSSNNPDHLKLFKSNINAASLLICSLIGMAIGIKFLTQS